MVLPPASRVQVRLDVLHPALRLADRLLQSRQIRLSPGDVRLERRLAAPQLQILLGNALGIGRQTLDFSSGFLQGPA